MHGNQKPKELLVALPILIAAGMCGHNKTPRISLNSKQLDRGCAHEFRVWSLRTNNSNRRAFSFGSRYFFLVRIAWQISLTAAPRVIVPEWNSTSPSLLNRASSKFLRDRGVAIASSRKSAFSAFMVSVMLSHFLSMDFRISPLEMVEDGVRRTRTGSSAQTTVWSNRTNAKTKSFFIRNSRHAAS